MAPSDKESKFTYQPKLTQWQPLSPPRRLRRFWHAVAHVGLRVFLWPLQLYLIGVLASLLVMTANLVLPKLLPQIVATAHGILTYVSSTEQLWFLAPLASLALTYPLVLAVFLVLAISILVVDWRVEHIRKRTRLRNLQQSNVYSGDNIPHLHLVGDRPFELHAENRRHSHSRHLQDSQSSKDEEETRDPLGYVDLVNVLYKLITASAGTTPLAISIEAKWGIGKTTMMQMIQNKLDPVGRDRHTRDNGVEFDIGKQNWKCYTVYFNAWKYGEKDANDNMGMRGALLSTVFDRMPPGVVRWHLGHSSPLRVFQLATDILTWALNRGGPSEQLLKKLDVSSLYRNEFEENFKRIMDHWQQSKKKKPLLVIFIDDLDRCSPAEVVNTLETIKLFFDVEGCVFVLGFDPSYVAKVIQKQFEEEVKYGTDYLKKLVQLNFALPRPQEIEFANFIKTSVKEMGLQEFFNEDMFGVLNGTEGSENPSPPSQKVEGYCRLILEGTDYNPREIRRFLNAVAVNAEILHNELASVQDRIALCMLLLLQVHWPTAYFDLVER